MTQYDKLFIPEKIPGIFAFRDNQGDVPVAIHGKFIVLTIDELRDLWETARAYEQDERLGNFFKRPDFETYLNAKGITI